MIRKLQLPASNQSFLSYFNLNLSILNFKKVIGFQEMYKTQFICLIIKP